MTATAANLLMRARNPGDLMPLPAITNKVFYENTMVFVDASTGYATDDDNGGANIFFGVNKNYLDMTGLTSGSLSVECYQSGEFEMLIGSNLQSAVGDPVYGIDNQTTQFSSSSASYVGRHSEYVSATKGFVKIDPLKAVGAT